MARDENKDVVPDLAGILHDVSNALTVVLGWAQQARMPGVTADRMHRALRALTYVVIGVSTAPHAFKLPAVFGWGPTGWVLGGGAIYILGAVVYGQVLSFGILFFPRFSIFAVFALMAAVLIIRPWGLLGRPLR